MKDPWLERMLRDPGRMASLQIVYLAFRVAAILSLAAGLVLLLCVLLGVLQPAPS